MNEALLSAIRNVAKEKALDFDTIAECGNFIVLIKQEEPIAIFHKSILEEEVKAMQECTHDPKETKGPIGMYHCPECGEMVLAGVEHPPNTLDE